MAEVILNNIVKRYDKAVVVHGVNATFNDGEFVVIVGPSGCGKSTILRMIAGLEEISEGEIRIANEVVNSVEPKDRKIAMVFQNYALYPHMTVFNNMAYGLKLRKHSKNEILQRVNEAAEMLQLAELLHRKPRQLSGGQRQRVAMGRALVRKPEVFLFDEPLSNLDAKLRHQMRVELKRLHNQLGTTMIYVTHDQVEAMTLADRIVVLNDGIIEQMGTPDQIYKTPVSVFVAGFIGSPPMNFLRATVESNGELRLSNGETMKFKNVTLSPGNLILGIRPEKVAISSEKSEKSILIEIDFIEKLGAGQLLYSHVGEDNFVISLQNGFHQASGKSWVDIKEEDIHFFDSSTGRSLNIC